MSGELSSDTTKEVKMRLIKSGLLAAAVGVILSFQVSTTFTQGSYKALYQITCGSQEMLFKLLEEVFGEREIARGMPMKGVLMIYHNQSSGSWSVVWMRPDGSACLVASGQEWEAISSISYRQTQRS